MTPTRIPPELLNPPPANRRKKKDSVTRAIQIMSAIALALSLTCLLMLGQAQPARESFFTRVFNVDVEPRMWDQFYLRASFGCLIATIMISGIGLLFNTMRLKREGDHFNRILLVLLALSAVGIVAFLIVYGRYLL